MPAKSPALVVEYCTDRVIRAMVVRDGANQRRNFISFYHQAYRAAVWDSRHDSLALAHIS
jgi:hypothetical protein